MHYKQDSVTFHTKCITSRGPAPNQKADIDVNDKKKGEREREKDEGNYPSMLPLVLAHPKMTSF